ncbi:MAG TPA: hypothetical protein VEC57_19990 [Candidatus Limnocylindrales bacterium]|nr:hypothetical protein [Candidatus Limnocylindrales bacterium]
MITTLTILTIVGTIGSIDVLYYHLYRFRLYGQPTCVAEEVTHLIRHAVFLAVLVVCLQPATEQYARIAFVLFAIDMTNSVVDVLLERRSRAPLGGLPSGEYLVHVLSSFGTGLAVASYTVALGSPAPQPEGLLKWQVWAMLASGCALFVIEATLFVRALTARRLQWPLTHGTAAGAPTA